MKIQSAELLETCAILSNVAYRSKMMYKKNGEILTEINGTKKFFCTEDSDISDPIREYNNKQDIWIDKDKKIIYCASSGTRILGNLVGGTFLNKFQSFTNDFFDNLDFFKGDLPKKTEAIRATNSKILEILDELSKSDSNFELSEWNFVYTGHCIGGSFATIAAEDMYLKIHSLKLDKKPSIKCLTFEPLGMNEVMKNFYKTYSPSGQPNIGNSNVENIIILNRENIANLANHQLEEAKIYELGFSNQTEPSIETTTKWVSKTIGPIVKTSEGFLSKTLKKIVGQKNVESIVNIVSPVLESVKNYVNNILSPSTKTKESSNIEALRINSIEQKDQNESKPTELSKNIVGFLDDLLTNIGIPLVKTFAKPSDVAFKKAEDEGVIHTVMEQMSEEHSLKFLRNIEEHNETGVNGVKTKLKNMLEKTTRIKYNEELLKRYELEIKFNGAPSKDDCDIKMDSTTDSGSPIFMSSKIIRKIKKGYDPKIDFQNQEIIPFNAELLERYNLEIASINQKNIDGDETIKMDPEYKGLSWLFFGAGEITLSKSILENMPSNYKDEIIDKTLDNTNIVSGYNDTFDDFCN